MVERQISSTCCRQSNPILQRLRSVKETEELDLIQKLVTLPNLVLDAYYLCKTERNRIWNQLIHEFIRNRSRFCLHANYRSGNNANVHYIENNQQCKAGDLILLDVAAEYANYSSDMSRTTIRSYTQRKRRSTMPCWMSKRSYKMLTTGTWNNTISKWGN
jgi:Xaa-Pro aminopeptidase